MICAKMFAKHQISLPRDSKIIQMPYPRAKAINQIAALCPPPSACRLDIDRCIIQALLSQQINGHYTNCGDGEEKYSLSMLFFQGYNKLIYMHVSISIFTTTVSFVLC